MSSGEKEHPGLLTEMPFWQASRFPCSWGFSFLSPLVHSCFDSADQVSDCSSVFKDGRGGAGATRGLAASPVPIHRRRPAAAGSASGGGSRRQVCNRGTWLKKLITAKCLCFVPLAADFMETLVRTACVQCAIKNIFKDRIVVMVE